MDWLNIVTINDLDNDGIVELVWIQTPHIGGILKVAKINAGALQVLDTESQYSNHEGGERNMCLSILTEQSSQKIFFQRKKWPNKAFNQPAISIIDLEMRKNFIICSTYNQSNLLLYEIP